MLNVTQKAARPCGRKSASMEIEKLLVDGDKGAFQSGTCSITGAAFADRRLAGFFAFLPRT
jgi:hypothetical protein